MSERSDRLPHTLMPIGLALLSIQQAVYGEREAPPPDGLAEFLAATVPIYEYRPHEEGKVQVVWREELKGGMFRRDGTELHFCDGRRARSSLAVNADDVRCVIEMLREPRSATRIQSRWTKLRSKRLRARSAELAHRAFELRSRASKLTLGED